MANDPLASGYIFNPTTGSLRYDPAAAALALSERAARAQAPAPATADYRGLSYDAFAGIWRIDPNAEPALPAARMVEVSEAGVQPWQKQLVEDLVASARMDSDLKVPDNLEVRWFKPESDFQREMRAAGRGLRSRAPLDVDESVQGFVETAHHNVVWVRQDAELGELAESVAHELHHSMTIERALEGDDVDLDDEAAAKTFGLEIRKVVEEVEREVKAHHARR